MATRYTLIGIEKAVLICTDHDMQFAKYGYRYLTEARFSFNRRYDLRAFLGDLLVALIRAPSRT